MSKWERCGNAFHGRAAVGQGDRAERALEHGEQITRPALQPGEVVRTRVGAVGVGGREPAAGRHVLEHVAVLAGARDERERRLAIPSSLVSSENRPLNNGPPTSEPASSVSSLRAARARRRQLAAPGRRRVVRGLTSRAPRSRWPGIARRSGQVSRGAAARNAELGSIALSLPACITKVWPGTPATYFSFTHANPPAHRIIAAGVPCPRCAPAGTQPALVTEERHREHAASSSPGSAGAAGARRSSGGV
jgi:hypothetical protein